MKKVLEAQNTTIYWDEENSLIKVIRDVKDQSISDEDYQKDLLLWRDVILEHQPKFQLVDMRHNNYTISPEMQAWINGSLMAPARKAGMKKVAFLVSEDLFAQVSIEQSMEEEEGKQFQTFYFEEENEAMEWLLK